MMVDRDNRNRADNQPGRPDPKSLTQSKMKSSYELAMERLNKVAPTNKLTSAQKQQLAELDSKYAAKIAGREIALRDEMAKAKVAGDLEKAEMLQQQLVKERKALQIELEGKKELVRS
jgi:predicted phage-related endonuclease